MTYDYETYNIGTGFEQIYRVLYFLFPIIMNTDTASKQVKIERRHPQTISILWFFSYTFGTCPSY